MRLAAWFKNVQAEHREANRIAACVKDGLQAIAKSDPVALKTALAPLKPTDLSGKQTSDLLKVAIDHGDVKIFKAALAATGDDPNASVVETVTHFVGRAGSYEIDVYTPVLDYALRVRNHDIALLLAKDSRTRIDDGGQNAFVMAKNGGMSDVAVVLAQRIAALRREQAQSWDNTAVKLSPPDA